MKIETIGRLGAVAGLFGITLLGGCTGDSNNNQAKTYTQIDRLARPAVNEVLATVANGRHAANNMDNPTDDSNSLANDIQNFMINTAGRSQATADTLKGVLVPDVLTADLSQTGSAAYLGVETGGFTGGKFGGRKLTDDVVDIDLGAIFGNTLSALKLVPDDGKEIPTLVSDNVGYTTAPKHYMDGVVSTAKFPYLGAPQ